MDVSEVRSNSETGRVLGISFAGKNVIVTRASGRGYRETENRAVRGSKGFEQYEERRDTMRREFVENTSSGVTKSIISEVGDMERPEWDTVETVEARSREEAHVATSELRKRLKDNFETETFTEQEESWVEYYTLRRTG